jgi:hypothetical protein
VRRGTPAVVAPVRGRVPRFSPPAVTPAAGGGRGELVDELLGDWPDPDSLEGSSRRQAGASRSLAGVLWVGWVLAILLGVFNLSTPAPRVTPTATASPTTAATASSAPAGGCAELAVAAWLAGDIATLASLTGTAPARMPAGVRTATRTYVISASAAGQPGVWRYIVGADVQSMQAGSWHPAGIQYFAVALAPASGGCQGYAVLGMPAQVAGPTGLSDPVAVNYPHTLSTTNTALADCLTRFFAALLAGDGELDRYTAPGAAIAPIVPAPYKSIQLTQLASTTTSPAGTTDAAAPDGTTLQLLVTVAATTVGGDDYPLTYPVGVDVRGGRWEVTAVQAAPALAPPDTRSSATPAFPLPSTGSPSPVPATTPSAPAGR